jgi:hypothetical protein
MRTFEEAFKETIITPNPEGLNVTEERNDTGVLEKESPTRH